MHRTMTPRLLLVAAIAPLLAGCLSPQALPQVQSPQEVSYDAGGADAADGLILVGLRVPSGPVPEGSYQPLEAATYVVRFTDVTDDGKLGEATVAARVCVVPMAYDAAFPDYCLRGEPAYRPVHARPGRYVLNVVEFGNRRYTGTASFAGGRIPRFLSYLRRAGDPVERPEQSFIVRPGVVTYIGDLTFVFGTAGRLPRVVLRRDDAAARRALDELPNVKGRLSFQSALGSGRAW